MSHCLQRNSVRIVAFNKCGHATIINSFNTAPGEKPHRGENALAEFTLKGDYKKAQIWDSPIVTLAYFRHPLARVASVWNKLMRDTWYTSFAQYGFVKGMTFPEFCNHLLDLDRESLDPHLRPQAESFRECRGWGGDTCIYRLDEMGTAWAQMVRTWDLDCTTNIVHMNRADYPDGKPWTALYDGNGHLIYELAQMYGEDLHIWRNRNI